MHAVHLCKYTQPTADMYALPATPSVYKANTQQCAKSPRPQVMGQKRPVIVPHLLQQGKQGDPAGC